MKRHGAHAVLGLCLSVFSLGGLVSGCGTEKGLAGPDSSQVSATPTVSVTTHTALGPQKPLRQV